MSVSQMEGLWNHLKPAMVFGPEYSSLRREHPIVTAILEGLDYGGAEFGLIARPLSEDHGRCVEWVKGLWESRVLTKVSTLMRRVEVRPDEGCRPDTVTQWMACLYRYLQAQPPRDEADLPPRMQHFLLVMSGTAWLPLDPSEKYQVCCSIPWWLCSFWSLCAQIIFHVEFLDTIKEYNGYVLVRLPYSSTFRDLTNLCSRTFWRKPVGVRVRYFWYRGYLTWPGVLHLAYQSIPDDLVTCTTFDVRMNAALEGSGTFQLV